jgi:hypothetical protein
MSTSVSSSIPTTSLVSTSYEPSAISFHYRRPTSRRSRRSCLGRMTSARPGEDRAGADVPAWARCNPLWRSDAADELALLALSTPLDTPSDPFVTGAFRGLSPGSPTQDPEHANLRCREYPELEMSDAPRLVSGWWGAPFKVPRKLSGVGKHLSAVDDTSWLANIVGVGASASRLVSLLISGRDGSRKAGRKLRSLRRGALAPSYPDALRRGRGAGASLRHHQHPHAGRHRDETAPRAPGAERAS